LQTSAGGSAAPTELDLPQIRFDPPQIGCRGVLRWRPFSAGVARLIQLDIAIQVGIIDLI
jgi:hypothetical protein